MCSLAYFDLEELERFEMTAELLRFGRNLLASQVDLPPDFYDVLNENYWDLLA